MERYGHYRTGYTQLGMTFTAQCSCGFSIQITAENMGNLISTRDRVLLSVDNHATAENAKIGVER